MATPFRFVFFAATVLANLSLITGNDRLEDWPSWRGPDQNSVSGATGLIDSFDPGGGPGSRVLWKSEAAAGISTPIVMNGRVFVIVRDQPGTPKDAEKVIALDAESGEVLWENVYNVFLSDLPAERVGWSNVCGDPETGRVYSLGACCFFQSIDAATGKTLWSRSLSEEFGMLSTYGGRTNTPVVFEDLVIISGVTTGWGETARPAHRFFAFDKRDGTLVWYTSTRPLPEDTTYSTPVIKQLSGQQVMVAGSGDGHVYGFQPRTGRILWQQPISRRGINTSVAIDEQGGIYTTHGEENLEGTAMGAVVRIDTSSASSDFPSSQTWRTEAIMCGKSSPLLLGDRLYVVEDSARLRVLDVETGAEIGKGMKLGTAMRGSLLYADGKIYACTAQGVFHVLKPTEDGVESVFKVRLPRGHEVGGSPIAAGGRLYLSTTGGLYCLGNESNLVASESSDRLAEASASPGGAPGAAPATTAPPVALADEQAEVATLQLVPAEAILRPGQAMPLRLVAYDAGGKRLPNLPGGVQFEVSGGGTIGDDDVLRVENSNRHSAIFVTARLGNHSATSRFRVIPPLPWSFEFGDRVVPVTWVGASYRHEPRVVDGEPVMVKITTLPKGTRSQTWFGGNEWSNYTITADVKAGAGSKLPDMGVIAQRYVLDLMGESQKLQIRTWAAQLRMAKSEPVTWQAGVWYTLKFQASIEDGVALLQGKVWPRAAAEPSGWTVTATDPSPNAVGSPGLFGNATNAEIIIDNVEVVSNESR